MNEHEVIKGIPIALNQRINAQKNTNDKLNRIYSLYSNCNSINKGELTNKNI